jgi:hypothetical protein
LHPDVELEEFIEFDERAESDVLSDVLQRFKEKSKAIEATAAPERQLPPRFGLIKKKSTAAASSEPKHLDEPRRAFHRVAVRLFGSCVTITSRNWMAYPR